MTPSNMRLTITNHPNSGAHKKEIYISIIGEDPSDSSKFGYVDFKSGKAVFSTKSSWQFDPSTMAKTLDGLSFPLNVPRLNSARIYFSVYDNLASFPASGPSASKGELTLFDKIEFENGDSNPNINGTSVDFYGISYVISGTDHSKGAVSFGYNKSRADIIGALSNCPTSPHTQRSGNNGILASSFMKNPTGEVLRVLAPKTMALTDWPQTKANDAWWATCCSHFLDDYVKKHCFKPGRKFSFYSKNYPNDKTVFYGSVDPSGNNINLWTDKANTVPYAPVPKLNIPCASWPDPNFETSPDLYHDVSGTQDQIDWGFLLLGNSAGTGAAENWGNDPLCMAIMVSICRGVMHRDDGTTSWIDSNKYYLGNGATPPKATEDMPIFYYSKILHEMGKDGKAYVLSYDDVYGENPSIFFAGHPDVTIDLYGLDKVLLKPV